LLPPLKQLLVAEVALVKLLSLLHYLLLQQIAMR
jgi:hypothetical protein